MPPSPPFSDRNGDDGPLPRVSVVIPVLNRAGYLPHVLGGLPRVDEIVVVDGGSSDDTAAVVHAMRPGAVLVRSARPGKGNALICGFAASTGDIVVTLEADGSTDPGEVPRFVRALLAGAEVAHGSRYRDGGADLVADRWTRLGNALLSRLVNAAFGTRFTDVTSGYNAYWRDSLTALDLPGAEDGRTGWGDGAEITLLINLRTATQGLRVVEVATVGYPRMHGGRHRLSGVWLALRTLAAEYLRSRRRDGRPAAPPGHDAIPGAAHREPVRRPALDPARQVMRLRPTGRHAAAASPGAHRSPDLGEYGTGVRRSGIYDTGAHHLDGVRTGRHDTGVHRTGVYDTALRRSGDYPTGLHHQPEDASSAVYRPAVPREVGGGRRRLDLPVRRAGGRPDLTVIPGEDGTADRRSERPRAVPGERSTR
ncbi:MAG TPA: glycosyltransferase family 2 protein [Actinoplanes sp.]|nr:glycosyltransferase family 2 protein [Actinoplanes sp.]